MARFLYIAALVVLMVAALLGIAWWEGWLAPAWSLRHVELAAQLRDRGTVAAVGRPPWSMRGVDTPYALIHDGPLGRALAGASMSAVVDAIRNGHYDGMLVRNDGALASPTTALGRLQAMRSVDGLTAVCLDDSAVLYETASPPEITQDDARRMITVVRLVLSGATSPPERLFPEAIRRAQPVEVALIVRDGHEPIIWRSTRGGSIARALLDVTFSVIDRWSTRQQEHYGRLRDALATKSITLALFYDKGVLGARTPAFLRRAVNPRVYSVGYEHLSDWEYALPPTPWQPAPDPVTALRTLARDHGISSPGYLRPELTLYRFRALQLMEEVPNGPVDLYDPR